MKIALLYALLAIIATAVNIGAQEALLRVYGGPHHILASVASGLVAGLIVKYILDKRYIFHFQACDAAQESRVFALYVTIGLVTTTIFFCFEFGFHVLFDASRGMRYFFLGGVGLMIGYIVKYQLDKRYVFKATE